MKCNYCGKEIQEFDKYCSNCGNKIINDNGNQVADELTIISKVCLWVFDLCLGIAIITRGGETLGAILVAFMVVCFIAGLLIINYVRIKYPIHDKSQRLYRWWLASIIILLLGFFGMWIYMLKSCGTS